MDFWESKPKNMLLPSTTCKYVFVEYIKGNFCGISLFVFDKLLDLLRTFERFLLVIVLGLCGSWCVKGL